jgi:co-chaperonin GroES (HSP10)
VVSYFLIPLKKSLHKAKFLRQDLAMTDGGDVRALDVKKGDKIIFGQYAGSTVKIDGEELLILSESEIFGVLEG